MKHSFLLSLTVLIYSCQIHKHVYNPPQEIQTRYYYGEVKITSPDGIVPYGPAKVSLLKRTIDRNHNTIIELTKQDGKEFDTRLTEIKNSSVFKVVDNSKNSFTGTVTFIGEYWNWDKWNYDLQMNDGSGKIIGAGTLMGNRLETTKRLLDADDNVQILIAEQFKEITVAEYEKLSK